MTELPHRKVLRRRRRGLLVVVLLMAVVGGLLVALQRESDAPAAMTTATIVQTTPAPLPVTTTADSPSTSTAVVPARLGSGQSVTFAFGGDVMFEEPIRSYLLERPADIFAPVAPILRRADLAMVNLETAVTDRGEPAPNKHYHFRAPASAFRALRAGGIDVVTLANNHGMDYGEVGLRDTLKSAKAAGVPLVGAGLNQRQAYAPYRVTISGQRIAIIAASQVIDAHLRASWLTSGSEPGLASAYDVPRLARAVRQAQATSDTVIVYLHWGSELDGCPTDMQRLLARDLVRAGADIIVGSHAHIQLGAGRLGRAFVAYGLGNFVFYADGALTTQTGVLEVTATGRRIDRYRWVPAQIKNGRPIPITGSDRGARIAEWRALRDCTDLKR